MNVPSTTVDALPQQPALTSPVDTSASVQMTTPITSSTMASSAKGKKEYFLIIVENSSDGLLKVWLSVLQSFKIHFEYDLCVRNCIACIV